MPQVPSQVLNNLGINLSAPTPDAPSYGMEEQYVRRREDEYNNYGGDASYGGGQTMYGENSRQYQENFYEDDSYEDNDYENPNEFAPNPDRYDREYHKNIKMSDMGFSPDIIGDSELIDYDNPYSNNSFEDREILAGGGLSDFWDLKNQIGDLRPNDSNYNPFGFVSGNVKMASAEDLFGFTSGGKGESKGGDLDELFGFGGGRRIASASADDLFGFSGVNSKGMMGGNNFDPQTMFGAFDKIKGLFKKKDEETDPSQYARMEDIVQQPASKPESPQYDNLAQDIVEASKLVSQKVKEDKENNGKNYARVNVDTEDAFDSPSQKHSYAPNAKPDEIPVGSDEKNKIKNYAGVTDDGITSAKKAIKEEKDGDKKSISQKLREGLLGQQARKYQADEAKKTGGFSLSVGRGSSSGSSDSSGHGTEISYQSPSAASLFGIGGMEGDDERLESGEFNAGVEGLGEDDVLGMGEMGESDIFGFQKYGDNETQTAKDLFGYSEGGTPQTGKDLFGFVGTSNGRPQTSEDLFGAGIGLNTGVNQSPLTFRETFGFSNPMGYEKPVVRQNEIRTNLVSGHQNYRPHSKRVKVINPPSNIYNKNRNKRYYAPPQIQYIQQVPDSTTVPQQVAPQTQRGLYNRVGHILDNNADYASNFAGYAYNLDVGGMIDGNDDGNMIGFNPAVIFGHNDFTAPAGSPMKKSTKKYRVTSITVPKKNVKSAKKTTPKKTTKKTSNKSKSTTKKTKSNSKGKVKYTKKNENKVADINKLIWG